MKRLLICSTCALCMLAVTIAAVFSVGIELVQREKQSGWREVLT